MMNNKNYNFLFLAFGLIIGALSTALCFTSCKSCSQESGASSGLYSSNKNVEKSESKDKAEAKTGESSYKKINSSDGKDIYALTQAAVVVAYVKANGQLPEYYITKKEAKSLGWRPGSDVCQAVAGKAIGGDRFSNREGSLPKDKGQTYTEADINYQCGHRNADRLVFSNDGHVYVTLDHYKSFEEK